MAIDQRIQSLEDEHKVLKGELKQNLENIRDSLYYKEIIRGK